MESGSKIVSPHDPNGLVVTIGGARGSAPVSAPCCSGFGGATTSILFQDPSGREALVIDAGSGLHNLLPELEKAERITLLFTHLHLDHLIGLPVFPYLFSGGKGVVLGAPDWGKISLEKTVKTLFSPPFWPITPFSKVTFTTLPSPSERIPFRTGPFEVRWMPVAHPGGCWAYRISTATRTAIVATDMEWRAMSDNGQREFLSFCRSPRPADILLMDGQFDGPEGDTHSGWGHSTWQEAVRVAKEAAAGRLALIHHDPESDDLTLSSRERQMKGHFPAGCFARERDHFLI